MSKHGPYKDGNYHIEIYGNPPTPNLVQGYNSKAIVNAYYEETWTTKGYCTIQISTNPNFPSERQAYYAGYIEGMLTCFPSAWWLSNNSVKCIGEGCDTTAKKVINWANKNLHYLQEQFKYPGKLNDPWWYQIYLYIQQLQGLTDGFNTTNTINPIDPSKNIMACTLEDMWNNALAAADLDDLPCIACSEDDDCFDDCSYVYLPGPSTNTSKSKKRVSFRALKKRKRLPLHCSATVLLLQDKSDLYVSHTAWDDLNCMIKIMRYYNFPFKRSANDHTTVETISVAYSGYASVLVSGDDFYITSSKLCLVSSEIGPAPNPMIYQDRGYMSDNVMFSAVRLNVALRLTTNNFDFAQMMYKMDSGTGNNDWLVVDYKKFKPGHLLESNAVWYCGSYPKMIKTYDVTNIINTKGVMGLYNIPYDKDMYDYGGWPGPNAKQAISDGWNKTKVENFYSYDKNPRANIVDNIAKSVKSIKDIQNLARFNDWYEGCGQDEPPCYAADGPGGANPWNAMASRADLVNPNSDYPDDLLQNCFGGIDSKVTSRKLMEDLNFWVIVGPAYNDNIDPFVFSKSRDGICDPEEYPISQIVDKWSFPWYETKWPLKVNKSSNKPQKYFLTWIYIILIVVTIYLLFSNYNIQFNSNWLPVAILILFVILIILLLILPKQYCDIPDRILKHTNEEYILCLVPRRMWGWGLETDEREVGYCGEAAFQSVMIYHGNYVSQGQVFIAGGNSTFLLSVNDDLVCDTYHLKYEQWPQRPNIDYKPIFAYIKAKIDQNLPVLMGVFSKEVSSEPSFDHTIPFFGYKLDHNKDIQELYYTDLYQLQIATLDCTKDDNGIPSCFKTRSECISAAEPRQPWIQCIPNVIGTYDPPNSNNPAENALLTVLGNEDPHNELYPIMLQMDSIYEPDWGTEDDVNADPIPISCTAVIGCLCSGKKYSLLRFDNPDDLPPGNFLESGKFTLRVDFTAKSKIERIPIKNTSDYPFMSNGTYFFRCVLNTDSHKKSIYSKGTNRTPNLDQLKHVKKGNKKNNRTVTSQSECGKGVNIEFTCGTKNTGKIHENWIMDFPDDQTMRCFPIKLRLVTPAYDSPSYPSCLFFNVTDDNGNVPDSTQGSIGNDGKIYFDNDNSYPFTCFEIGKNGNTRIMMGEDGVTRSTLTPV